MSTKMDNPVDAANATAEAMKQQTNPGDVASIARDEIKTAHETFTGNPSDYRGYINTLKGSLSQNNQPEWLRDVEIFDSAATANDTIDGKTAANGTLITRADDVAQVKALTGSPDNKDELYKLLDNYSATKNSDTSDAARGDGKIGRGDLQAFIDDAQSGQDTASAQYLAKHPEAAPAILKMYDRLGDAPGFIVRDELLNEMGYSGGDAQTNFQNDNPELGAVVTVGENGKPDSLVIPDGTARGFHYNESGNIDGINKTNPDGSTKQYRKDEQGQWVDENGSSAGFAKPSFDENGNYSYYTPDANDPSKLVQTSIDTKSGVTSAAEVAAIDAAGNSVLAEPVEAADAPVASGATGKMGTLDVVDAEGGPEYTINSGDTLTAISRRILNLQPGQADPANIEDVVKSLAAANKYDDPDLILAGAKMKVPTDILAAAQPEQQALTPEQQALTPEQQALTPEQQALTPEQQALTPEQQALTPEQQALTPEQQALTPEQQALTPEQQALTPEQQALMPQQQGLTPEQQALLMPQQQGLTPEQQALMPQQQGLTPEQQALLLPQQQVLSPDQQALAPQQSPLPVSEDPSLTSAAPTTEPMGPLPAGQGQTWTDLVAPPEVYGQSADSAPKV